MPELRQLRTFVAVAEQLNFTRAAERLHMGQQAVSKSVRALERDLGVELLERTTREVRLTDAGAALLADGRRALAAADAAFERARTVGRGLTGTVDVGVSPAVGAAVREQVVDVLRDGAPDLRVSLVEVRPGAIPKLLRGRRLDLVLARTFDGGPEIDSAALRPTPAELFVPAGHRLAARAGADAKPVPLAELDGERLLTYNPPGTPYTDMLLARLAAGGARVEPVEALVIGQHGMRELRDQNAIAIAAQGWPAGDGVVRLPLAGDVTLPLLVLWPAGVVSPAVRRLRAALSTSADSPSPSFGERTG